MFACDANTLAFLAEIFHGVFDLCPRPHILFGYKQIIIYYLSYGLAVSIINVRAPMQSKSADTTDKARRQSACKQENNNEVRVNCVTPRLHV